MHPMIIRAILATSACMFAAGLAAEDAAPSAAAQNAVQAAMGAKVYAENCTRCHEAPDPATRDARAWRSISLHMRMFADISKQEQQELLAFLRTFNVAKGK